MNPSLLCLKCRRARRIVDKCPSTVWAYEFGWVSSPSRTQQNIGDLQSAGLLH
jgi:hypothetical protein